MINYTKINRILFGLLGMLLIMFFWFLTMGNKGIMLAIIKAITSPQKQSSITIEKEDLTFALPQKTGLMESGNDYKKFITFTSGSKLYSDYYKDALPSSGWNFVDQMGSAFFYEKNGAARPARAHDCVAARLRQKAGGHLY